MVGKLKCEISLKVSVKKSNFKTVILIFSIIFMSVNGHTYLKGYKPK